MKLCAALLAAGRGERFGRNKLLADFDGRPLVCRAMDLAESLRLEHTAVVTGCSEIAALAGVYGFEVIANERADLGQSHSIHLAVLWARQCSADALLICACDQPLLTGESIKRLIVGFKGRGRKLACLEDGTHRGNPAVFSSECFDQMLELSGDCGARGILEANAQELTVIRCAKENELCDCDTPQEMDQLRKLYAGNETAWDE